MEKFVRAFNQDGRDFIRASRGYLKEWHDTEKEVIIEKKATGHQRKRKGATEKERIPIPRTVDHFVMNLPATATEFLGNDP